MRSMRSKSWPTMPKPDGVTDEQFAKAKQASLAQAHSGLGLVYFRQQQFDKAVTEMQQAVKLDHNVPTPWISTFSESASVN